MNSKAGSNEPKTANANEENPSNINSATASVEVAEGGGGGGGESIAVVVVNENESSNNQSRPSRTPFTNLSQVDADLALARTLQEQERAYMMIRMNGDGGVFGSWEAGGYMHGDDDDFDDPSEDEYDGSDDDDDDDEHDHEHEHDDYYNDDDDEEDAFDVHAHAENGNDDVNPGIELDPAAFPSDEAYARALQDAEDREMAARLLSLAGINEMDVGDTEDSEDHGTNSQDTWEEVDPDELSYEELIALGEVVGTESRGLSADTIASLPSHNYKMQSNQDGSSESCVICRLDYEDGDALTVLTCKHSYHSECINNWLRINKVCPVCNAEVSTSGSTSL